MSKLGFTLRAKRDPAEIAEYIGKDSPQNASNFVVRLIKKCQLAATRPLAIGRDRDDLAPGLRSTPYGNYVIFYHLHGDGVEILRVIHGARDTKRTFES